MQERHSNWGKIIIILFIIVVLTILLWLWLRPMTTVTENDEAEAVVTSMACTAGDVENPVFATYDAREVTYTLNLLFRDDALALLTYQFIGTYESAEQAEAVYPYLIADFNLDLQDRGLGSTYFTGTTSGRMDNQLQITFTADEETLTPAASDYFFMEADEKGRLPSSAQEVRAELVGHSFVCKDVVTE